MPEKEEEMSAAVFIYDHEPARVYAIACEADVVYQIRRRMEKEGVPPNRVIVGLEMPQEKLRKIVAPTDERRRG